MADHFFHLGGHSLLATRLAGQVRARLHRELPIRTIFDSPVLGELARALRSLPMAGQALRVAVRPALLPLLAQRRLWFLHRLEGGSASYNIPVGLRLRGALDVAALGQALCDVVLRHESLRTVLLEEHGEPCQRILRPPRCLLCCRPGPVRRMSCRLIWRVRRARALIWPARCRCAQRCSRSGR